jgi:hypothetical protein
MGQRRTLHENIFGGFCQIKISGERWCVELFFVLSTHFSPGCVIAVGGRRRKRGPMITPLVIEPQVAVVAAVIALTSLDSAALHLRSFPHPSSCCALMTEVGHDGGSSRSTHRSSHSIIIIRLCVCSVVCVRVEEV